MLYLWRKVRNIRAKLLRNKKKFVELNLIDRTNVRKEQPVYDDDDKNVFSV